MNVVYIGNEKTPQEHRYQEVNGSQNNGLGKTANQTTVHSLSEEEGIQKTFSSDKRESD